MSQEKGEVLECVSSLHSSVCFTAPPSALLWKFYFLLCEWLGDERLQSGNVRDTFSFSETLQLIVYVLTVAPCINDLCDSVL